jgi:hypothetical protein
VEPDDEILLVVGDVAALDVGPEVVQPPQPAALAAPTQTCTHTISRVVVDLVLVYIYDMLIPKRNLKEKLINNLFTGFLGHLPPFAFAVGLDVGGQGIVFLGRPRPSLHPFLGAARPPAHLSLSLSVSS